jgi:hypothetical protein
MKKLVFICAIMCFAISGSLMAQQEGIHKKKKGIANRDVERQLTEDLNNRFAFTRTAPVVWDNTEYGYDATYAENGQEYMSRYDINGNYIGTLKRSQWNDDVPSEVRAGYDKSRYKTYKVVSFWEMADKDSRGYYIQATDPRGAIQRIWVDQKGTVSEYPIDNQNRPKSRPDDRD